MGWTVGAGINLVTALAVAAMGLLVLRVRPRRGANVAFAAFALCFGLAFAYFNAAWAYAFDFDPWLRLQGPFLAGMGVALAALALLFPVPFARKEARRLALPAAAALVAAVATALPSGEGWFWGAPDIGAVDPPWDVVVADVVYNAGVYFAHFLLATRYLGLPTSRERHQAALFAAAIGIFDGATTGEALLYMAGNAGVDTALKATWTGALAAFSVGLGLAWAWNAVRARGDDAVQAREVAAVQIAAPAAAIGFLAFVPEGGVLEESFRGIVRVVMVAVLAYALLKRQVLNIEFTAKRTVKQSTVAGVFLAAFFVASELASSLLSERYGPFLGIATAGLLVFALHPLQRLGERVSDAAVPGVQTTPEYVRFRQFDIYRAAYANAIRDGKVTDKEREMLAILRRELQIAEADAEALESDLRRAAGVEPSTA